MPDILQLGSEQIDSLLLAYYNDLDELTRQALAGRVREDDFRREMERIVRAALLLAFVTGGADVTTSPEAERKLREQIRLQLNSIDVLADDIYSGRYSRRAVRDARPGLPMQTADEGRAKLLNRLALWTFTLGGVYHAGQTFAPSFLVNGVPTEPTYVWRYDPSKKHCTDCARLNGVVLTADEWRRAGIDPQSPDLECGGWRCGCYRELTDQPSIGLENVPI